MPCDTLAESRESMLVMECEVGPMVSTSLLRSSSHALRAAGTVFGYSEPSSRDQDLVA